MEAPEFTTKLLPYSHHNVRFSCHPQSRTKQRQSLHGPLSLQMPRYVHVTPVTYYVVQKCPSQAILMLDRVNRPSPEEDGMPVPTVMTLDRSATWVAPATANTPDSLDDLLPGHRVLVFQYLNSPCLSASGWTDIGLDPSHYTAHLANTGEFHPRALALRVKALGFH